MFIPYNAADSPDMVNAFDPLRDLPRLMPRFYVPPLEEKPQNPIMDSLKLEHANTTLPKRRAPVLLPPELAVLSLGTAQTRGKEEVTRDSGVESLWRKAAVRKLGVRASLLSWDRLRTTHPTSASPTAFLSEQDEFVYTSARYHVQPRLYNPTHQIVTVTQTELLRCLKSTVLGIASQLHVWDPTSERFVQVGTEKNGKQGVLLVDGKDDVVSASFIARFLTIGTLLRRLEGLLLSLRTRSAREGPTIHALAHSLSTTLDLIRETLVDCPPNNVDLVPGSKPLGLSAIWSHYAPYEELLVALAELYGRNQSLEPHQYLNLDSSPVPLLSRIYDQLALHFERQSPTLIRATIAFILSATSQEYIQEVSRSIGFGGQPKALKPPRTRSSDHLDLSLDDEDEDEEEDIFDLLDVIQTAFPTFFPEKILELLPAAQKSLVLLRIAQPDHPLLAENPMKATVRWLWTKEEVDAAWNGLPLPSVAASTDAHAAPSTGTSITYNPELADFQTFDLEPGILATRSSLPNPQTHFQHTSLRHFISSFPPSLPAMTPTLPSLTSLSFQHLLRHASTLSATLLALFMDKEGKLNLRAHLEILRSFLLVEKPAFKARLLGALFGDQGEYEVSAGRTAHSMSIKPMRRKHSHSHNEGGAQGSGGSHPWAVGLSPDLLQRETWPPVGADLSFFLRTVIVDSLDRGRESEEGGYVRGEVEAEAEWRLGFAVKDLDVGVGGKGRRGWLDPLSIEALDFLYMDYKPPRPLEILISPDILSKYQRMFAFILRLLRVESALKSLFRISSHRAVAKVLFPTLAKSRKLVLHFRFVAQAFVSSLSGYVFDTAIAGNFDPFLARLPPPTSSSGSGSNPGLHDTPDPPSAADPPPDDDDPSPTSSFTSVFDLAQAHSLLLDDILSACLLRSGQRGVGDLLRHALELVLEFTIVVGELHRGRVEEYQAAPMVEEVWRMFGVRMMTLTKVLKGLVDKSASKLSVDGPAGGKRRPTGGLDALYHLLLRLDLTDWWSKQAQAQAKQE